MDKKWKTVIWAIFVIAIIIAPSFLSKPATYIYIDGINGVKPGTNGHILGTDTLGRDVFAGIISGARISLFLSLISVVMALFFAFALNFVTSYVGNNRLKLNSIQLLLLIFFSPVIYYYAFIAVNFALLISVVFFLALIAILFLFLRNLSGIGKPIIKVPLDTIGQQVYKFLLSIPILILLLILIGLTPKNNIWATGLIIGILMWPIFYRYIRLEILSEKANDRFKSLKNLGYSDLRIVFGQFMPTMLPILSTPIIFSIVSVIFLEANLSFLGIGLGGEYVTWGSLLAEAKRNTSAWWLIVFPSLCLFIVYFVLNKWLNTEQKEFL